VRLPQATLYTLLLALGAVAARRLGLNGVGHVSEVARLFAVAVDYGLLAGEHRFEKQGNDRCIRTVGG